MPKVVRVSQMEKVEKASQMEKAEKVPQTAKVEKVSQTVKVVRVSQTAEEERAVAKGGEKVEKGATLACLHTMERGTMVRLLTTPTWTAELSAHNTSSRLFSFSIAIN